MTTCQPTGTTNGDRQHFLFLFSEGQKYIYAPSFSKAANWNQSHHVHVRERKLKNVKFKQQPLI
jgi:hypothetical protein